MTDLSTLRGAFTERQSHYVGGRWVPARAAARFEVIDASTATLMGRVPRGTAEDAAEAVRAASAAFASWAATPIQERAAYIARIAAGLEARAEELAVLIAQEVGTPIGISRRIQVGFPIAQWKSYAGMAGSLQLEEMVGNSLVVRDPIGVVVAITPWNYPLNQITLKVAPALLAGCTVVLKPSEIAPLNAYVLAEVIAEAGLPAGVFNLVCGAGPEVGEALVMHSEVNAVSFTGSTAAGRRVAELSAGTIKRVSLELGGKSASVILEGADLETAVTATLTSCYANAGQTCVAQTRLLVPQGRVEEAAGIAKRWAESLTVGDALDEVTRLGPLISAAQLERVRTHIAKGIADGAQLITGGAEPPTGVGAGFFVRPTVFTTTDPKIGIAQEEVFGPVLTILGYADEADAVRIANDTPYGLGGAVWGATDADALTVARQLSTGQINVNGGPFNMLAPFGGFKQSGYGREGGQYGVDEFLEYKALHLKMPA